MLLAKTVLVMVSFASLVMSYSEGMASGKYELAARKKAVQSETPVKRVSKRLSDDRICDELLLETVREAAKKHRVEVELVLAVVQVESGGVIRARSHRGALGLMQLTPSTARMLGVSDPLHYRDNIFGGTKYLAQLLRQFDGNIDLALAAYNAGPYAVKRFANIPPYKETRNYVKRVKGHYQKLLSRSIPTRAA